MSIENDTGNSGLACLKACNLIKQGIIVHPELIAEFSDWPFYAFTYAYYLNGRFIEGEKAIYEDDIYALDYATNIMKDKLPTPVHNRILLSLDPESPELLKRYIDMLKGAANDESL